MLKLDKNREKHLRGCAHKLDVVVSIGKLGLEQPVIKTFEDVFKTRELIKVKFHSDDRDERSELASAVASQCQAYLVGSIGKTAVYYRPFSDKGPLSKKQVANKIRFS